MLSGGGGVADLDIVFSAGLEEAFEACGGVFWALALLAMGEEEDNTASGLPFRFSTDDKLVDDGLSAISKIAELGFPEAEEFGVVEGVAEIESEDSGFGEA